MIALKHVLVATDFSEASEAAQAYGRELARTFGASLEFLHVAPDFSTSLLAYQGLTVDVGRLQTQSEESAREKLQSYLSDEDRQQLRAKGTVLTSPRPADAILGYARDCNANLIVVGTHTKGTMAHLFIGSVAERVIRSAACPVLVVRHPEREFVLPDALQVASRATA